eukprot:TRINITY_DN8485_c0_g1_i4.p1 TRINITY_DN8485_c0_g1~~TRINITY_DN8485_c0_g1_i4.p1  ORF type:complete len:859 (+),score=310.87 TRINITY_DN8485_c0_g1_i4:195-2771(+)
MDKLTVEVVEAIDLLGLDPSGTSDPFCVLTLSSSDKQHKTKVVKKNNFPKWNEIFTFNNVNPSDTNTILTIALCDWERLRSESWVIQNRFLGQVQIPICDLKQNATNDEWMELESRKDKKDAVKGRIHLRLLISNSEMMQSPPSALSPAVRKSLIGSPSAKSPMARRRYSELVDKDALNAMTSEEIKRQEIILELADTEEAYVDDLNVLIEVFMVGCKRLLDKQQIGAIFANIETIVPLHVELLKSLQEARKNNPKITNIAEILEPYVDRLKFYAVYCSNQPTTIPKLSDYQEKSTALRMFLEECLLNPECRQMNLSSYLIKPLQRLCRYPLFLKELLKHTPENHPEFEQLTRVSDSFSEVVTSVNERTRQVERVQQLLALVPLFEDLNKEAPSEFELVNHTRYLVRTTVGKAEKKEATLFLFNDLLLICHLGKKTGHVQKYKVKRVLFLKSVVLNVSQDSDIELVDSEGHTIPISTSNPDEKAAFLSDIREAIENNSAKRLLENSNSENKHSADKRRWSVAPSRASSSNKLAEVGKQRSGEAEDVKLGQHESKETKLKNEALEKELRSSKETKGIDVLNSSVVRNRRTMFEGTPIQPPQPSTANNNSIRSRKVSVTGESPLKVEPGRSLVRSPSSDGVVERLRRELDMANQKIATMQEEREKEKNAEGAVQKVSSQDGNLVQLERLKKELALANEKIASQESNGRMISRVTSQDGTLVLLEKAKKDLAAANEKLSAKEEKIKEQEAQIQSLNEKLARNVKERRNSKSGRRESESKVVELEEKVKELESRLQNSEENTQKKQRDEQAALLVQNEELLKSTRKFYKMLKKASRKSGSTSSSFIGSPGGKLDEDSPEDKK